MEFTFDLFGFFIDSELKIKSFWFCSLTTFDIHSAEEEINKNLLLIGRGQGKWFLELFGKWKFGPQEFSPIR
jgi:hypothetical protein